MQMSPGFKKAWNIVSGILVTVVVIVALLLAGARLVGLQVYHVLSASMEPTYSPGDLLYVKETDPNQVRVGDPITFVLNDDLVVATHRVVEIDRENQTFRTQGDARSTPDAAPVHFKNLVGVPVFSIPLLGYLSNFIQTSPGMYITVAVMLLLTLMVFLPDLLKKKTVPESKEET